MKMNLTLSHHQENQNPNMSQKSRFDLESSSKFKKKIGPESKIKSYPKSKIQNQNCELESMSPKHLFLEHSTKVASNTISSWDTLRRLHPNTSLSWKLYGGYIPTIFLPKHIQ